MPRSSVEQASFLQGEWGPIAQGRSDDPKYVQAMARCRNGYPVEEGAWIRRSGTQFLIPTRNRTYGKLLPFDGSDTCSFAMLFTDNNLQFLTQTSLVFDNTIATITGTDNTNGHVTIGTAQAGWTAGQFMIVFPDASSSLYPYSEALEVGLRNRILTFGSKIDSTHFTFNDDLGNALNFGTWPAGALVGAQIMRVLNLTTTYAGSTVLSKLRSVQAEYQSIILSATVAPQVVQITTEGTLTADPVFSFGALSMIDGPYLDPQSQTLTLSALTGAVTATAGSGVFVATDVGRHMRVFTQPAAWASGTAYVVGNQVTDGSGQWWSCIVANTGQPPGQPAIVAGVTTVYWVPAPLAGSWAWGKITAYTSATQVTWTIDTTIPNMVLQSANGMTATTWELGVYSTTTGYPTCGAYAQGRLWLGGVVLNRFDTTVSNGVVLGAATFSPTDPYGNVLDNSGMSETFNSASLNQIQWMIADYQGVLMGTLNGEFLVGASSANDPITPTSIDQREVTKYGSANIEPRRAGMAVIFAQKFGRRVMEFLADAFSQKFSGRHFNKYAKHMTVSGIAELAYQEELSPIVWVRMNNGTLAGATYRRESRFVTEPPTVEGWHLHTHGHSRLFTSMAVVPGVSGLLDRLFLVTNDPTPTTSATPPTNYFVEILQPQFDDQAAITAGRFVDQAAPWGPGNSGSDCGGGNASTFKPTGAVTTSTAFTPDMSTLAPFPALDGAATPNAAGQAVLKGATFFTGVGMLYNLPRVAANKRSLSLSVWVGVTDYPLAAGALLCSPGQTNQSAAWLAGGTAVNTTTGFLVALPAPGSYTTWGYTAIPGVDGARVLSDSWVPPPGSVSWMHLMVSLKSTGAPSPSVTVTAAINETVIENATSLGTFGSAADQYAFTNLWPFADQLGGITPLGLCAWALGGACPLTNSNNAGGAGSDGNLPVLSNVPYGSSGYRGSVAELWAIAGTFVDWTNSATRAKFHQLDSVTGAYAPVSLGKDGTKPGLGTPWLYLTGAPSVFPINRVNGQRVSVFYGGGPFNPPLTLSPLNFP